MNREYLDLPVVLPRRAIHAAQKELECLIEAQTEMLRSDKRPTAERYVQLHNEINARAWAVHYMVSYPNPADRPDGYEEVMATAAMYDSWMPLENEAAQ